MSICSYYNSNYKRSNEHYSGSNQKRENSLNFYSCKKRTGNSKEQDESRSGV